MHLFVWLINSSLVLKYSSDMRLLSVGLPFSRFNFVVFLIIIIIIIIIIIMGTAVAQ